MTDPLKLDAKQRLEKIAGQVNGLQKMIDTERPCIDMLQQLAAVKVALEQVSVQFLGEHLQTCVLHSGPEPVEGCCEGLTREQQTAEIKAALRLFMRHN
ncbi:MAG TPA: metal-sensitive transcriptional regulator [Fimbriimonadaceae bacterium]|nr:metal-sensitive transcriptional regulator [Fimbriimonadaceae bacterium]